MMGSFKKYIGEFLGNGAPANGNDGRKKDYGDLDDIRIGRQEANQLRERNRARIGPKNRPRANANFAGNGSRRIPRKERMVKSNGKVRKRQPSEEYGGIKSMWKSLKTIFSNEEQDLNLMQRACGNINVMVPQNKRLSGPEERRRLKERIARSEAFKRKVLQVKYDDRMLEGIRRGRSRQREDGLAVHNLTADQVTLLRKKVDDLEARLKNTMEDLQITQKKLKFANEKNALLESLLDDANIDSDYVKSRRDIKNIQKDNLKPDSELPPSPRRTVNPLFTSSPMRNPSSNLPKDEPASTAEFYNKYPKIPETEVLAKGQRDHSLSPIRIDYSKYSM